MMEQVVINLCVNARDAMAPKGGQLTIDARLVELSAEASQVNPDACPGSFVCLSVADTGCGMDRETLKHLFEPFFTTKEAGKGTGLGLATVYRITKKHKGWVEVISEMGKGTTFRIYLPALTKAPLVSPESRPALQIQRGTETILLVDDDTAVRDMTALGLQLFGYRVLEATSGQEAIQVWDDHAGEIHLLFTDMRMPGGLTGMELFERFKRTKATLKGIISSGYSDEIVRSYGLVDPGITFLPKPYDVKALASTVRNCLDQASPLRVSDPTS
jgi:two-component system, cell cycle sensor histidine kinase and response regulator CckA